MAYSQLVHPTVTSMKAFKKINKKPTKDSVGSGQLRPLINKVKTFIWLLYYCRILTNYSFHNKGMNVTPKCHLCDLYKEDIDHIFFQCTDALNRPLPPNILPDQATVEN